MKNLIFRVVMSTVITLLFPLSIFAEEKIHVGVAANYIQAFKELASEFEAKNNCKVDAAFTSSGNLYGQINNGAPYDMFLSADEERPEKLFKSGIALRPFVYAKGQVILWSARKNFCSVKKWDIALRSESVKKISIANTNTAPYGMSSMKAIQKAGLYEKLKLKIVNSQDIAQSFQYASTGAVDAGFCAFSAAYSNEGRNGCYYIVEEAPAIIQSACIIKNAKNRKLAEKFAAFLVSKDAKKIRAKYGYR